MTPEPRAFMHLIAQACLAAASISQTGTCNDETISHLSKTGKEKQDFGNLAVRHKQKAQYAVFWKSIKFFFSLVLNSSCYFELVQSRHKTKYNG